MALNAPYTPSTVIQSTQVSNDLTGLANGSNDTAANALNNFRKDFADYVQSGCVFSQTSGLVGQMTAGVVLIAGTYYAPSSIASHTFTASKDTYCDMTTAGTVTYVEVANGAAAPALTANSLRIAKVVTSGAAITGVTIIGTDGTQPIYNKSPMLKSIKTGGTNAGAGGGDTNVMQFGDLKICWGLTNASAAVATNGTQALAVTFPVTYNVAPKVFATLSDVTGDTRLGIELSSVATTGFSANVASFAATAGSTGKAHWMAIGY
jgi:hypothetical protein